MSRNEEFGQGQPTEGLSDSDKAILAHARTMSSHPGHRMNSIRETFDMSETSYFQKLNRIIDHPDALAHDAQTVRRFQRIREKGQRARSERMDAYRDSGVRPYGQDMAQ